MREAQIRAAIQSAIEALRAEARPLNFDRAHERSTAHRLAVHMEPHFSPEWDIDCEYDRDGQDRKRLYGIRECDGRTTNDILPDIIVHHRSSEGREHNLLVIEMKKDDATDPCDHQKLVLLTRPDGHYQYQHGLYINISGGEFTCTWYKGGEALG
jgi:hypothetical protein